MKGLKEVVAWLYGLADITITFLGCALTVDVVDHNPVINMIGLAALGLGIFMFLRQGRVLDWAFRD